MEIKKFETAMIKDVIDLWNESVCPYSVYAPFTEAVFREKFLNNPQFDEDGLVVAYFNGKIVGFGNAIYHNQGKAPSETPGYITCVAVDKNYWRKGIGTTILHTLENFLKQRGKTFVRNLFFNPVKLEWYVPGYCRHEHPNAPAIPFNSPFYFLLLANGYNVNGQEDAYHVDLKNYCLPDAVVERMRANEADGYTITIYDSSKHYGFDELFAALKSEDWRNQINNNLKKDKPNPILIAQKDGEILGFTGPLSTLSSGRAYLAGLAVHPKAQRRGLGKSLFCMLCEESKKNGAEFMTLHTGVTNPAREIYLYAGMRVVQSFAIMRKELK
ncbi:MAG: GNAT family N-acetyltransferase [Bacilli bacterium]|nr:GNAT family N-acetyltransferase [Bacilli bacterium]MDD4077961.1 GNAT family N-acetyltransferase [Bacilli bacterium]MDD4388770.1 GNAT family N-acetyltransferase [Bacilli bacterium]